MPLALTIQKIEGGKPGQVYYPLQLKQVPKPTPGEGEVLVRITAAALNHRDLFIRQHLYPGISFEHPLLADGYGIVVETGPGVNPELQRKPVLLTPSRGWEEDPVGPEGDVVSPVVMGGAALLDAGAAQEYLVVPQDELVEAPLHLSPAQGAALPLVGLTAWRALITKSGNAVPGRNILLTGIGGGVALQTLQFAVALGINAWVTSGDQEKIDKAVAMGAKGGVIYKNKDWHTELMRLLPKDRPYIDAIIDGAGGDLVPKAVKFLKTGGVISMYGMTVGPKLDWPIQAVLKNIELRGSMMGNKKEFRDMVNFVREHKIQPVVSRVVTGLSNLDGIDSLFEDMKAGRQFGKLVIEIGGENGDSPKL
ncbi:NAD(P)-binding protein [Thozetella sp. PMI_491]|nr:NAD(P)-binding protein [Thozetella sp. PMI_491]